MEEYKEYRKKRTRNFLNMVIVCIILTMIPVSIVYVSAYYQEKEYVVSVKEKEIRGDTFLVSAKMENGESKVFAFSDSIVKNRFYSEEDYFDIESNTKYRFIVIGYRNAFLGMYETIIYYEKIE